MPRPLRILVAEDEPGDVLLLKRAFAQSGLEVTVNYVGNGREAVRFLRQVTPVEGNSAPSLLLLDLKMPQLGGLQVLKWVRRQENLGQVLVVILTASENPDDMRAAYELGADGFYTKPVDPADMTELLRDMERQWLRIHATPECGSLCEIC